MGGGGQVHTRVSITPVSQVMNQMCMGRHEPACMQHGTFCILVRPQSQHAYDGARGQLLRLPYKMQGMRPSPPGSLRVAEDAGRYIGCASSITFTLAGDTMNSDNGFRASQKSTHADPGMAGSWNASRARQAMAAPAVQRFSRHFHCH